MFPEYPKFKDLELKDRKTLSEYLEKTSSQICELNLANLFIWNDFDRSQITLINKNLCILNNPLNEAPFFLMPLGDHKIPETIETCLNHCGKVSRLSEDFIPLLPAKKHHLTCLRSHFDYIYLTEKLAELKGRKFDGKRNHIKRFKKHFPDYKYRPLNSSCKKEALELFEKWFKIREQSRFFPKLAHNSQKTALENAFSLFEELNLSGGVILVDHKLAGFVIGSPTNHETLSLHFLYTNPKLAGINQILLWEACNKTFKSYKYINLEQDLGIPGLRTAKLSYHPEKLERKFEIESA